MSVRAGHDTGRAATPKLAVGILSSELPPRGGGAEHQAATVAVHLARAGHRVTVFTRAASAGPTLAQQHGCTVRRRSAVRAPGIRFLADLLTSLAIIGRERQRLDVIVAYQTVIDGVIAALARKLFGIPFIVSVRSEKEYRLRHNVKSRWLGPFVLEAADRVAVQSPTLGEAMLAELGSSGHARLAARLQSKLCVLPNGIDLPAPGRRDGDVVLYLGRLVEDKGVRFLVEAMRRCPGEHLVVAGDGPERGALEAAAGGARNVEFAGRLDREGVEALLRRARLLVLPSLRNEGMPNAIMEAMAHGVPVVATRGGGVADLVEDGETGFLTEPGDAAALACCIERLAGDAALRQRMSENCVEEMRQYAWPAVVERIERELAAFPPRSG